jgi:glycosyltransferase involved in cell wall biosynthesis
LLHCYHISDRLTLRLFRKVLAVSDAIARSLRRSGLNPEKVAMIANGIDVTPFASRSTTQDVEMGKEKRTIIGVVGRLTPQKGHQYLLQAAPDILSAFPNVTFMFVGDGQERQTLQHMVSSLGIDKNVVFAGQRSDMPAVYASIDILVLPSINEGMPMTLIEAMAARRPVIATDVGDVAKLIRHGETGLLVEAANPSALKSAIIQLLSDPAQCSMLALQGMSWVCENFSADGMARQYRDVYADLVSHGAPQSQCNAGVI